MFESVVKDPGDDALQRASRIFYVLTVLACIGIVFRIIQFLAEPGLPGVVSVVMAVVSAALAFVTARGIERQRPWAKLLGYTQGALSLFNFPIGTVIGAAVLIYLNRASKAGLFARGPAQPETKPFSNPA